MIARRREPKNTPLPSPFPEGWYFVATRQAVQKAGLLQKTWMGENIVIWCGESGQICVAEAVCPHLGADLGLPLEGAYATVGLSARSTATSSM